MFVRCVNFFNKNAGVWVLRCTRGAGAQRRIRAAALSSAAVLRCSRVAKQYAVSGRQPISRHPFHGAAELRSNTPFPGWGVSPLASGGNVAPTRRRRKKGMDTYGFHPSFESPRFPLFLSRRTERLCRSYLCSGPKKGTAVPLPPRRLGLTPTIPFTAALKPLELCYTQLRKTSAICRDNAATMRKTSADTVPLCELLTK